MSLIILSPTIVTIWKLLTLKLLMSNTLKINCHLLELIK